MNTKNSKPVKKVHLANYYIAGFGYWDGCEAFEQLKIGSCLQLVREEENRFDPYAVAIYYREFKLGFIPRGSPTMTSPSTSIWGWRISMRSVSPASPQTFTRSCRLR